MSVSVPTPARASNDAAAAPVAPQPAMATCAFARASCPSIPIPGKSICREYRSLSSKAEEEVGEALLERLADEAKLNVEGDIEAAFVPPEEAALS